MTINRTLMIAMPSCVCLVGLSFGRKWGEERDNEVGATTAAGEKAGQ